MRSWRRITEATDDEVPSAIKRDNVTFNPLAMPVNTESVGLFSPRSTLDSMARLTFDANASSSIVIPALCRRWRTISPKVLLMRPDCRSGLTGRLVALALISLSLVSGLLECEMGFRSGRTSASSDNRDLGGSDVTDCEDAPQTWVHRAETHNSPTTPDFEKQILEGPASALNSVQREHPRFMWHAANRRSREAQIEL